MQQVIEQPVSPDAEKARAFFSMVAAMHTAAGQPLTPSQVDHCKRWIWRGMKQGYAPAAIAEDHIYRPEDHDAD